MTGVESTPKAVTEKEKCRVVTALDRTKPSDNPNSGYSRDTHKGSIPWKRLDPSLNSFFPIVCFRISGGGTYGLESISVLLWQAQERRVQAS